jgi:hypothetical protein
VRVSLARCHLRPCTGRTTRGVHYLVRMAQHHMLLLGGLYDAFFHQAEPVSRHDDVFKMTLAQGTRHGPTYPREDDRCLYKAPVVWSGPEDAAGALGAVNGQVERAFSRPGAHGDTGHLIGNGSSP